MSIDCNGIPRSSHDTLRTAAAARNQVDGHCRGRTASEHCATVTQPKPELAEVCLTCPCQGRRAKGSFRFTLSSASQTLLLSSSPTRKSLRLDTPNHPPPACFRQRSTSGTSSSFLVPATVANVEATCIRCFGQRQQRAEAYHCAPIQTLTTQDARTRSAPNSLCDQTLGRHYDGMLLSIPTHP